MATSGSKAGSGLDELRELFFPVPRFGTESAFDPASVYINLQCNPLAHLHRLHGVIMLPAALKLNHSRLAPMS